MDYWGPKGMLAPLSNYLGGGGGGGGGGCPPLCSYAYDNLSVIFDMYEIIVD